MLIELLITVLITSILCLFVWVICQHGRNIVAKISKKQLIEIAEKKMSDLNAHDVDEAAKIIAGSARSMGIEVVE